MEEFKENIGDLYYEKAVKLMEEVEEKKREEEKTTITIQLSKFKKSLTKKDKAGEDKKVAADSSNKEEKN